VKKIEMILSVKGMSNNADAKDQPNHDQEDNDALVDQQEIP
jgi:hypothetical protein